MCQKQDRFSVYERLRLLNGMLIEAQRDRCGCFAMRRGAGVLINDVPVCCTHGCIAVTWTVRAMLDAQLSQVERALGEEQFRARLYGYSAHQVANTISKQARSPVGTRTRPGGTEVPDQQLLLHDRVESVSHKTSQHNSEWHRLQGCVGVGIAVHQL